MTTDEPPQNAFEVSSSRSVLQALQALSSSAKQVLRVTITSSAVQFRCEDDGKVCQSSLRFPRTYFTAFRFSERPSTFSVHLSALSDALRVFAALPDVPVVFTETEDHLVLETAEQDGATAVSMYAHLAILGSTDITDLMDHWQAPATQFVTGTLALREAVEDLEWPQGHVQITVKARPLQVSLSGEGNVGSLDVVLPTNLLRQPVIQETSVSHHYPYKFAKAALTGVPALKAELSTQVAIDANGLLKVVHILPAGRNSAPPPADPTQAAAQGSPDVVLTYAIQPMFDDGLVDDDP